MSRLRTRRRILACVAAATLALLASCDLAGSRDAARAVAERYFAAATDENYDAALALYSAKFFAATPRDRFREQLVQLHARCGIPGPHVLKKWTASSNFSSGTSQTTLVYEVRYTKCQVAETLAVSGSGRGEARIDAHELTVLGAPSPAGTSSTTV